MAPAHRLACWIFHHLLLIATRACRTFVSVVPGNWKSTLLPSTYRPPFSCRGLSAHLGLIAACLFSFVGPQEKERAAATVVLNEILAKNESLLRCGSPGADSHRLHFERELRPRSYVCMLRRDWPAYTLHRCVQKLWFCACSRSRQRSVSPAGIAPLSSYGLRTQSASTADVWVNESKIDALESLPSVTFGGSFTLQDVPARFKLISQVVEDSHEDIDDTMLEPTVFNDLDQNDVMRGL
jgi:hypothetical protein